MLEVLNNPTNFQPQPLLEVLKILRNQIKQNRKETGESRATKPFTSIIDKKSLNLKALKIINSLPIEISLTRDANGNFLFFTGGEDNVAYDWGDELMEELDMVGEYNPFDSELTKAQELDFVLNNVERDLLDFFQSAASLTIHNHPKRKKIGFVKKPPSSASVEDIRSSQIANRMIDILIEDGKLLIYCGGENFFIRENELLNLEISEQKKKMQEYGFLLGEYPINSKETRYILGKLRENKL